MRVIPGISCVLQTSSVAVTAVALRALDRKVPPGLAVEGRKNPLTQKDLFHEGTIKEGLKLVNPTAYQLATAVSCLRLHSGLNERDVRLLNSVVEFLDRVSVGDLRCPEDGMNTAE